MTNRPAETGTLSRRTAGNPVRPLRSPFAVAAETFLLAAAAIAVARSRQPFDHGWWLASYLALVGGLSQLVLGAGRLMLAPDSASESAGGRRFAAELVLWNVGTVLVPVGVLADTTEVVAGGGVLLLIALALFAADSRTPGLAERHRAHQSLVYAYRGAVVFLAGSVVVGTGLAEALPWQW